MKARVRAWMTDKPVLAFYVLAFAITWLAWFPAAAQSHGVPPFTSPIFANPVLFIVGGLGPGVAAVVVMRALHGEAGDQRLLAALRRWRVRTVWWVVAVFAPIAIWLAAAGLGATLSSDVARLSSWLALLPSLLWYLLQAVPEEVGWRGFALPRLQARYSALTASLIVGALWALWHLPLLVDSRNVMSQYPLGAWSVATMAAAVLYTWLFNNARGSVLLVVVFHAMSNTVGGLAPDRTADVVSDAIVQAVLAAVIVVVFGATHLSRRRERVTADDVTTPEGEPSNGRQGKEPTRRSSAYR